MWRLSLLVFLDKGFKFQPDVYTGCHNVMMMSMNFTDIAILNIQGADYCYIFLAELVKLRK